MTEAEAAGTIAVLVEYLRASGLVPGATPEWVRSSPAGLAALIPGFMGWSAGPAVCPDRGARVALVIHQAGGQAEFTYDALPAWVLGRLAAADAVDLALYHILRETRPDERLVWTGAPDDARPLGALYFGATVVMGEGKEALLF